MLSVVEKACQFEGDMRRGVVVIESDQGADNFGGAIEELHGIDARNEAIKYAASRGMHGPCLNGNMVGPYPINSEGFSLEFVKDANQEPLPPRHPRMQPARYRVDVPVHARI